MLQKARERVTKRHSEEIIGEIVERWRIVSEGVGNRQGSKHWEKQNVIIINMLSMGISEVEIMSLIKVRSNRVQRLRSYDPNSSRKKKPPSHAFNTASIEFMKSQYNSWNLEDGFPCPHRRIKQYFVMDGMTWSKVYEMYKDAWIALPIENKAKISCMAYRTFTQYLRYFFPAVRLTRNKQDACDACVRLNLILEDPAATAEAKTNAKAELDAHNSAARDQRHALSQFTKNYAKIYGVEKDIPDRILPDYIDEEHDESNRTLGRVLLVCEDFGQGIALPHYGHVWPSCDYFNSNLILHLYVISDISRNRNNMLLYDERCQKKDKDALCSLRLQFDIRSRADCIERGKTFPHHFISVRDNCVAQNKSNTTMKYACMQSMLFYERVLLLFLLPGHSHMAADRATAQGKNSLKLQNLYTPTGVASRMNTVANMNCEFVDHNDSQTAAFTGWKNFLDKFINNMPSNFTSFYVFEFYNGKVRMQHLVSDNIEDAHEIELVANVKATRGAIMRELFGITTMKRVDIGINNVKLQRKENCTLDRKKLLSITKKFGTIPEQYLAYYPDPEIELEEEHGEEEVAVVQSGLQRSRAPSNSIAPGARPVGRPRKSQRVAPDSNQSSILRFLRK